MEIKEIKLQLIIHKKEITRKEFGEDGENFTAAFITAMDPKNIKLVNQLELIRFRKCSTSHCCYLFLLNLN